MAQYAILIYEAEAGYANAGQEAWQQAMEAHGRFAGQVGEHGAKILGGDALEPTEHRDVDPRRHRHRRAVRRDEGGARRFLPDRGARSRPRHRDRQALPGTVRRRRGASDHGHLGRLTLSG